MHVRRNVMAAIVAGAALVIPALNGVAEPPAQGLLEGPKVSEDAEREPQQQRRRGERMGQIAPQTPLRDWMAAMREIEFTDEQRREVKSIAAEFFTQRRQVEMSQSEPDRERIEQIGRRRAQGKELTERERVVMRRMESQRPEVEAFQRKLWGVLTTEQQEQFKAKLAELRERQSKVQSRRGEWRGVQSPTNDMMLTQQDALRQRPPQGRTDARAEHRGGQSPADDTMQRQQDVPQSPTAEPERPRDRRRNADQMAERRAKFLRSRQSADAKRPVRHTDGEPSPREREFSFEEDQQTQKSDE